MRLSTSTNIFAYDRGKNRAVSMEDSIRVCAEAGYRFLDANLCSQCREGMPMFLDDWETWAYQIKETADHCGISFKQSHGPYVAFEEALVHPDGTRLSDEYMEVMMDRCIRASAILGVEWMVVHPFTMNDASGYAPKKSFEYNREFYGRWGEACARNQVGMAMENMSGNWYFYKYGNTAEELLELIHAIGNPAVKICIDTGHAHLAERNIGQMLRMVGRDLRAMHVDDNHGGKVDEHLAPFAGTIDWKDVMTALGEIGYAHDFSFEVHHLAHKYPREVQAGMVKFSYALGQYLLGMVEKGNES